MKEKIEEIMRSEGLTAAEFAEKTGINRSGLSHIMNGRNNPSLDFVMKIHHAFPSATLDWLLDGDGDSYSVNHTSSINNETLFDENSIFPSQSAGDKEYRKETESKRSDYPSKTIVKQEVKYVEKPQRKITEIRIFFDDDTFEIFIPRK